LYMTSYLLYLALVLLISKEHIVVLIMAFLAPFAAFPAMRTDCICLVLLLLYVIGYIGIRRSLERFPSNTETDDSEAKKESLDRSKAFLYNAWPFALLRYAYSGRISFSVRLLFLLLTSWWIVVVTWTFMFLEGRDRDLMIPLAIFMACGFAIMRLMWFFTFCRPPINIWGRLFTLRLIVPSYDVVFIAPILLCSIGIGLPIWLDGIGMKSNWAMSITLCVELFLLVLMPPSLHS